MQQRCICPVPRSAANKNTHCLPTKVLQDIAFLPRSLGIQTFRFYWPRGYSSQGTGSQGASSSSGVLRTRCAAGVLCLTQWKTDVTPPEPFKIMGFRAQPCCCCIVLWTRLQWTVTDWTTFAHVQNRSGSADEGIYICTPSAMQNVFWQLLSVY